jgi:hypothetical protein
LPRSSYTSCHQQPIITIWLSMVHRLAINAYTCIIPPKY